MTRARLAAALFVATTVLAALPVPGAADPHAASSGPPFTLRGVVHGSYGPVWDHEARLDTIEWIADAGGNTYVHAPHENPYQHTAWREPYPDWMLAEWDREIAFAHGVGVEWTAYVNPGKPLADQAAYSRDICFACPEDFDLLMTKFDWLHDRGVRLFLLGFDDVVKVSTHPQDAVAFGAGDYAYGLMMASLANRMQARFADSTIILGQADYFGTTPTDTNTALALALDPRVVVIWTGPFVFAVRVLPQDVDAFAATVSPPGGPRRRVVVWDNFAANDVTGLSGITTMPSAYRMVDWDYPTGDGIPAQIPIGPVKGRESDLVGHIEGILLNPPLQPHAALLPIRTVVAFQSDPWGYTGESIVCPHAPWATRRADCLAEQAWLDATVDLAGGSAAGGAAIADVANQMRATPYDRVDAPHFTARRDAFLDALATPFWSTAGDALAAELAREAASARTVAAGAVGARLADELWQHLESLQTNVRAGLLATDLLAAQRPSLDAAAARTGTVVHISGVATRADPARVALLAAELDAAHAQSLAWPFVTHGDRWRTDLNAVYAAENRMDEFVAAAQATTAQWLPSAAAARTGPMTLTVDGQPVPIMPDGSFSVTAIRPGPAAIEIVVTDAAGARTGTTLAV